MTNPDLQCGDYIQNRTVFLMETVTEAIRAVNASSNFTLGFASFPLHLSHWTTDWTVPNSFPLFGFCILTDLPPTSTEEKIRNILPAEISK